MKKILLCPLIALSLMACDSNSESEPVSSLVADAQTLLNEHQELWHGAAPADYSYWLNIGESTKGCNTDDAVDQFPPVIVTVVQDEVESVWSMATQSEIPPSQISPYGTMKDNFAVMQDWLDSEPVFIGLPFDDAEALPDFHPSLGYPRTFGARMKTASSCHFFYFQIHDFQ